MKKKSKKIIVLIIVLGMLLIMILLCLIFYRQHKVTEILTEIKAAEVESVQCTGTSGGIDGQFEYTLSKEEISSFIDLLHNIELGKKVREEQALSAGAVTYYNILFKSGDKLSISPGPYFWIDGEYFVFENKDELWENVLE